MAAIRGGKEKIVFIIGILVLCLTLIVSIPGDRMLKQYAEDLKDRLLHRLEDSFGVDLSYSSISPSFLRSLEIRNFTIRDRKDPRTFARISSLKIRYRLFALLSGNLGEGIEEIVLEDAYIETNESTLTRLKESYRGREGSPFLDTEKGLEKVPRVVGKGVLVKFTSYFGTITGRDMFFSLTQEGETKVLQLTSNLSYQGIEDLPWKGLETRVELTSRFKNLTEYTESTVVFERIETDTFLLSRQAFKVATEGTKVSVKRLEDRVPIDLSVSYDPREKRISASFLCETFSPESLIQSRKPSPTLFWLDATVSGKGELSYSMDTGNLSYRGYFHGILPHGFLQTSTYLRMDFSGNTREVLFSDLYLKNQYGRISFQGRLPFPDLFPEGYLTLEHFIYLTPYPIDGSGNIRRIDRGVEITGPFLSWGKAGFHQYGIALYLAEGSRFDIRSAEASFSLTPESKPIQVYAILPEGDLGQVLGGITLEDLPLRLSSPLLEQLGGEEILKTLEDVPPLLISARSFFQISGEGWKVDIPHFTLQEEGKEEHFVRGSLRYNPDGTFQIPHMEFQWDEQRGLASIRGKRLDRWILEFDTDLEMYDKVYRFSTLLDPAGYARITGSHRLQLELHWGQGVGAFGSLSVEKLPLELPPLKDILVGGSVEFFYSSNTSWVVDLKNVQLSLSPDLVGRALDITLNGTILPGQGTLTSLQIKDPFTSLEGSGVFEFSLEAPRGKVRAILYGKAEQEQYSFQGTYEGGVLSVDLEFLHVPLARIFPQGKIGGIVEGRIRGEDILRSREVSADFRVEGGRYERSTFEGRFSFTLSETLVEAHRIELTYNEFLFLQGKAKADLGKGELEWSTDARVTLFKSPLQGKSVGKLTFDASGTLLDMPSRGFHLRRGESSFTVLDAVVPKEYREWNIQLVKEGTQFLFSGGPDHAIEGRIDTTGSFALQVTSPVPIAFEATGVFLEEGKIQASVRNILFSLSTFKQYLDFQGFRIDEGVVRGTLSMEGFLQDPSFSGELTVDSGKARLAIAPEDLGPFRARLSFKDKTVTLNPVTLTTRGGTVQVGGSFELERYQLGNASIWVDTGPTGGVRIDANFNGVLVDGIGKGRVVIEVQDQEVRISGKVIASNTKITLGEELLSEQAPPPVQDMRLSVDLSIETGKLVEFVWPTDNFPIIRTYAALGQTLRIQVDTQNGYFLVRGNIGIRGGQVYYFDRIFYLREGRIVFNERGDRFDPIISARAEIRENTQTGLVRIYLVADNTRLSQFSPRFESDPSLSPLEIFTLLGGGNVLTLGTQEAVNLSSALLLSSDLFLQSEIIRAFERDMRNRFNLDLFSIRTQIFQNVLSDVLQPQESVPLYQTVPSLGRYLDKSSVFLGKYLGSDLFLEYLIQLRAEDPLTSNIRRFGGIGIESEVVFEWKTPFFTLEWSLRPKNPEELFIRDNTLSFRWRYSY